MRRRQLARADAPDAPVVSVRAAGFEDVPAALRLIEGAIEHGCRDHYGRAQRRAVFLAYASNLFVDAVGPFELLAGEIGGQLAAVAQIDVDAGALRALFVDAARQGQGVGRALLAAVEARARAAGCSRLRGAMSLNAVPFYVQAGFVARVGPEWLHSAGLRVKVAWMEKRLSEERGPLSLTISRG
jgi:putative acetyltransferase